jgi:hypothetical protein
VRRKFAKYAARCPARIRAATSRWKKIQLYGGGGGGGGGGNITARIAINALLFATR